MRNIYSLIMLLSFSLSAQDSSSDSILTVKDVYLEINKIKNYNDSIILSLKNFNNSSNKKLTNLKRFAYKLNDIIDLNYSENKAINDSLFKINEKFILKLNENIEQLEKQTQIQFKNTKYFETLENKLNKSFNFIIIFFILFISSLLFFGLNIKKLKLKFESKFNELFLAQKSLDENVLSISTAIDKFKIQNSSFSTAIDNLKIQNSSLSKNLKSFSQDLNKIKSSLE